MQGYKLALAATALCAATVSTAAHAGTVLVPPGIDGQGDGNYNNNAPFATNMHQQQIFAGADFGTAPISITGVSFRTDYYYGNNFSVTLSNISMYLSTAKTTVGTFSSTFANNVGTDSTLVYSGALTLTGTRIDLGNNTTAFDINIVFQNAFTYNPLAGALLLETFNSGSITGTAPIMDASNQYSTDTKRVFNADLNAAMGLGGTTSNIALVAEFTTAPAVAAVPEPATWGMMILGFGLMGGALRHRKRSTTVRFA